MREIGVESRMKGTRQGMKSTEEEPPIEKGAHLTSAHVDEEQKSSVRCQSSSGSQEGALLSDSTGRRTKDPRLALVGKETSCSRKVRPSSSGADSEGRVPGYTSPHTPALAKPLTLPNVYLSAFIPSIGGLLRWPN